MIKTASFNEPATPQRLTKKTQNKKSHAKLDLPVIVSL